MRPIGFYPVTHNGSEKRIEVWWASRDGMRSPVSLYFRINERWITPYEQQKRGWKISFMVFMSVMLRGRYAPAISDLISSKNTLLSKIPKDSTWVGVSLPIPTGAA